MPWLLPEIAAGFGTGDITVGLFVSVGGRLRDRHGVRDLIPTGFRCAQLTTVTGLSLANALSAVSPTLPCYSPPAPSPGGELPGRLRLTSPGVCPVDLRHLPS